MEGGREGFDGGADDAQRAGGRGRLGAGVDPAPLALIHESQARNFCFAVRNLIGPTQKRRAKATRARAL
jgi:hypothetical protein